MFSPNNRRVRFPVFRTLVLLVWLLGVPGLRPAYHHHQLGNRSAAEASRLVEHLKIYQHPDWQDTEKLHLHWLVQIDGSAIPGFPNSSPVIEHGQVVAHPEVDPSIVGSEGIDFSGMLGFLGPPGCSVVVQPSKISHRLDRWRESEVPKHSRFAFYTTTLYSAAYL